MGTQSCPACSNVASCGCPAICCYAIHAGLLSFRYVFQVKAQPNAVFASALLRRRSGCELPVPHTGLAPCYINVPSRISYSSSVLRGACAILKFDINQRHFS